MGHPFPIDSRKEVKLMFGKLISAGTRGLIASETYCFQHGNIPTHYCMSGGMPGGGCRIGMLPQGGICAIGGQGVGA